MILTRGRAIALVVLEVDRVEELALEPLDFFDRERLGGPGLELEDPRVTDRLRDPGVELADRKPNLEAAEEEASGVGGLVI